jgi:MFS transporter, ACS family, solute carrier family 17 (sodium-dependent inorganic phosphate cotransporter), member 5
MTFSFYRQNSWLSALPYLAMWILSNVSSMTADALTKRNVLSTTQTRKIFNSIGTDSARVPVLRSDLLLIAHARLSSASLFVNRHFLQRMRPTIDRRFDNHCQRHQRCHLFRLSSTRRFNRLNLLRLVKLYSNKSQVNHIDLAPNFAGVAMGFTNCLANICGFLAPYVVGVMVTTEVTEIFAFLSLTYKHGT